MMGVLPLQFPAGENGDSLGLTGRSPTRRGSCGDRRERTGRRDADGGAPYLIPGPRPDDTPHEWDYYRHGGILLHAVRRAAAG